MSLFFVIMKGNCDDLLPWPFTCNVTMMVLDQVGTNHKKYIFKPDPSNNSFMKPQSDMNRGTGCPNLIKLSNLEAPSSPYLKNDTIYLKFIVDIEKATAVTR